jgi:O-antigen ligase
MDAFALAAVATMGGIAAVVVCARIWRDPMAGLCLWVVLLPVARTIASFLGYPVDGGPPVLRKLTPGDPVLLLTAVAAILAPAPPGGGLGGRQGRRIVGLFAAFTVLGILSAFFAEAGAQALVEIATYAWLCASLVLVCRLLGSRAQLERVLAAFRWSAVVACIAGTAGALLLLHGSRDNWLVRDGRVTGLFEAPNQVQSFMTAAIPFLCAGAVSRRVPWAARVAYAALAIGSLGTVLASGSRGGVVLTALVIWLMFALAAPRAAAIGTCVALVAAGPAWRVFEQHQDDLPFAVRRALSFADTDSQTLRELSHGRANQLEAWSTAFAEHPILGVGLDQFRYRVPQVVLGAKAQEMHNSYLAVLAETGLAGALVMFAILATVLARSMAFLRATWRARQPELFHLAAALLVSYVALLLYGTFQYGLRQRYFWLVVALIVSVPRLYARPAVVRTR